MNNWVGIGNLVRDPELSYTQNKQTAVCRFTVAINRPQRNGEDQGADYIRIVVWGRLGENCDRYLQKGKKVCVRGEIRTGSYPDKKTGQTVYTTEVWASDVEFLTPAGQMPAQTQSRPAPQPKAEEMPRAITSPPQRKNQQMQINYDDLPDSFSASEDDIPF